MTGRSMVQLIYDYYWLTPLRRQMVQLLYILILKGFLLIRIHLLNCKHNKRLVWCRLLLLYCFYQLNGLKFKQIIRGNSLSIVEIRTIGPIIVWVLRRFIDQSMMYNRLVQFSFNFCMRFNT